MTLRIDLLLTTLTISLLLTGTARAGLLQSDSADPVDAGHVETELNGIYTVDKAQRSGVTAKCHATDADLTITAGLKSGMDLSIALPYTLASRERIGGLLAIKSDGLNDMTVDLKVRLVDTRAIKLAIRPGLLLPTGKSSDGLSDGRLGLTTALLASREFADGKLLLYINGGYERHNYRDVQVRTATRHDIFIATAALEAEAAPGLFLSAELVMGTNPARDDSTLPAFAVAGTKFEFTPAVEGYAGVKAGLTKPADDLAVLLGLVIKL